MKKTFVLALLMIFIVGIYYFQEDIKNSLNTDRISGKATKVIDVIKEEGVVSVYFCPREDCEEMLSNFILTAEEYAYCAFFDLDLPKVINSLNNLSSRGIDVKIVVDGDNYDIVKELNFARHDNRSAYMHNKFCVIDGKRISSGSMNPTKSCAYKNNNNLLLVDSRTLAENYEKEFQELWNYEFGKGEKTEYPIVYLNGARIENYFCPEDECSKHVKEALSKAEKSIYFMTFSFTHDGIANILLIKNDEGIPVKGVFEKRGSGSEYSKYKVLSFQGADVRLDNNSAVMHHKVFIIDNRTVITGSFNPSINADRSNDENILIIEDDNITKRFIEEFEYVWKNYSSYK